MKYMLQEIEELMLTAIKSYMFKPELLVGELQALYSIYRDLKVISNGKTESGDAQ